MRIAGDVVIENVNEGRDSVGSYISYTLGANFENLFLWGTAAINGTGNSLDNVLLGNSANNILTGGAGNDNLWGGIGDDTLIGGLGDDYYTVDSLGDVVIENVSEGNDTVNSSVSYILGANVEDLFLDGTAAINGTGNSLDNDLFGNSANNILTGSAGNDNFWGGIGDDTLVGGAGTDTLSGYTGSDRFTFNSRTEGIDWITDFSVIDDTIQVSRAGFSETLTIGTLSLTAFFQGTAATTPNHRFIYNSHNGFLLFDPDGTGSQSSIEIATLNTGLGITNADIVVIA